MILLYNNGIIEDGHAKNLVLTELEINDIFNDFAVLKTFRFLEIPDCWCVYGENKKIKTEEFNKLASDIMGVNIFSPLLFIHDTEIDPDWNLANDPILTSYEKFKSSLFAILDKIAEEILNENDKEYDDNSKVFLNTIGPTDDKRVLFEFNPHLQNENFYTPLFFNKFADRILNYVKKNYKKNNPFLVYADNKIIIMMHNENIEYLLNKLTASFEKREQYEECLEIQKVKDYWMNKINIPKKKRVARKNKEAEK